MTVSEIWRNIPGYGGYYQASTLGRVRSVDRVVTDKNGYKKRIKGYLRIQRVNNRGGYKMVSLSKNGKNIYYQVHKLIMLTFVGPRPAGQQIRHGSNGSLDNSVANLCYGTSSQDGLDKRRDGTHTGRAVIRSDGIYFESMAIAAEKNF